MAGRRGARSSGGSSTVIITLLMLFILAGAGTGVTLWAMCYLTPKAEVSHEGQIAFPSLTRPIKAYEKITREDLIDMEKQQLRPIWLDENLVKEGMLRDLSKIIGRVAARDKQPGYILSEADLLPTGTRAGVTAGVPAGKRSFSFDVEKVPGLELLRQGDRFDILAALPARKEPVSNIEPAALLGGIKPPDTRSGQLARQTGIKPLVLGGTMVALTKGANQSTAGAQPLTSKTVTRGSRKQHNIVATIAVEPEEVSPLTEALGLEVSLYCVARSGHLSKEETKKETINYDGMIPVVATSQKVNAFTALKAEDLADSVTGRLNIFYFKPEQVQEDWITDYNALQGRVVSRQVSPGSILTQSMLLPAGTRPGFVAGAPPGMVVLPVPESSMEGLGQLKPGDKFSVYVRLSEKLRPAFPRNDWASLQGAIKSVEDQKLEQELQTGISQVLKEAVFIGETNENRSDQATDKSDQERILGIAVTESGVVSLSRLLEKDSNLFVTAVSGRSENSESIPTQEQQRSASIESPDAIAAESGFSYEIMAISFNEELEQEYISLPVTARKVEAYTKLTVTDFVDPSTGKLRILMFPADSVEPGWVREVSQLIDRVVSRDIDVGRVIDQASLLPPGTKPGSTAGIPPGMLGVPVTGLQVQGLDLVSSLNRGDRFKIMASRPPLDFSVLGGTVRSSLASTDAIQEMESLGEVNQRARVETLCESVMLVDFGDEVETVQTRTTNETHSKSETQLTADGPIRVETKTSIPQVSERVVKTSSFLLAVDPADIKKVTEALSMKIPLTALPLPGSTQSSSIPLQPVPPQESVKRKKPLPRPVVMEHVRGDRITREVWVKPTERGTLSQLPLEQSHLDAKKSQ